MTLKKQNDNLEIAIFFGNNSEKSITIQSLFNQIKQGRRNIYFFKICLKGLGIHWRVIAAAKLVKLVLYYLEY